MLEKKIQLLEYNKKWLDLNFLTLESLEKQLQEFKNSVDTNPEHFRYKTFTEFLAANPIINSSRLQDLFTIIKLEKDLSLAQTMAIDLLKIKSLSEIEFTTVTEFIENTFDSYMNKYIEKEKQWRQKRLDEK